MMTTFYVGNNMCPVSLAGLCSRTTSDFIQLRHSKPRRDFYLCGYVELSAIFLDNVPIDCIQSGGMIKAFGAFVCWRVKIPRFDQPKPRTPFRYHCQHRVKVAFAYLNLNLFLMKQHTMNIHALVFFFALPFCQLVKRNSAGRGPNHEEDV